MVSGLREALAYVCGNEVRNKGILGPVILLDRLSDGTLELLGASSVAKVIVMVSWPSSSGSSRVGNVGYCRGDSMVQVFVY
jgi:hypothetical protein